MHLSIVIPTYRRPVLLERCLRALRKQDYDPAAYEIIVVDDAGDAATRRVVERYMHGLPPVRYLQAVDRHGPAAARNLGWRAAHGGIIAFTDDDTVPARSWLGAGAAVCAGDVAGAWGRTLVPLPAEPPTDYEREIGRLAHAEAITANCFYRKEALFEVGGFDERFTTAWREDSDLFFSLIARGRKIVHVSDAVVVHPVRPASWGISLYTQRKSMFNALLYKKHPRLYRERIQPRRPWHYYASVIALVVALASAVYRQFFLLAAAGGIWLGFTTEFCARRLQHTSRRRGHVVEMIATSALIPFLSVYWRLYGALKYRVFFL